MSKYHAKRCEMDGFKFDSQAEMRRYQELRLLEKAGEIDNLEVHQPMGLHSPTEQGRDVKEITTYAPDFEYFDVMKSKWVWEDVKGVRTPLYKLKRKWVKAEYGIDITEVEA